MCCWNIGSSNHTSLGCSDPVSSTDENFSRNLTAAGGSLPSTFDLGFVIIESDSDE